MASLFSLKNAILNSLSKCCHDRCYSSCTFKYVGESERTGQRYYRCSECGGFELNESNPS